MNTKSLLFTIGTISFAIITNAQSAISSETTSDDYNSLINSLINGNNKKEKILEVVRNFTRVKILESNNVGLRPGSVYDNITIFESLAEYPQPGFNYEFIDSGLGAAEPLYPMYQKGHQGSWLQLVPAFFSNKNRHIDHYSSLTTPEGCLVEGIYGLRHIDEYPQDMFTAERAQGYEQIVLRAEHYTRLRSNSECGHHMSEEPDPNFNPMEFVKKYHKAMLPTDLPEKELNRFEWKLSAIRHMSEERNKNKWPRFDLEKLNHNSLWYYPTGHNFDYDINTVRPQKNLNHLNQAKHLVIQATPDIQNLIPLRRVLSNDDFSRVLNFMHGKPTPDYDPSTEPGQDALMLSDVTEKNYYTSGLSMEKIKSVVSDVSDLSHYKLVSIVARPYEPQEDPTWSEKKIIPQLRFVFQLMDPRNPNRPFEQLYFHLLFDVVDRYADEATRNSQHWNFLQKWDQLIASKQNKEPLFINKLNSFIDEFTAKPLETLSFSSSLTGIWIFGSLSRSYNHYNELQPIRIVREGIDVGYYSSTYDNDIFRAVATQSTGERKATLEKHLDDLTVSFYRDPKRNDPIANNFGRMTCAQCHQLAGRDGVHMSINDGIDSRIQTPIRASEYFFHEADRQLQLGSIYWNNK